MLSPQKSEILPVSPTLRSDSRTVSSTHVLRNSSLQTSSSTRPLTSCLNCENKALCTAIFFCCSYRTVSSLFFSNSYFRCIFLSLLRLRAFVEALAGIQWTHSSALRTTALQTVTTVFHLSVYTVVYICPSGTTKLLAILGWFS